MKKLLFLLTLLPFLGKAQSDSINMDVKVNFVSPIDVFNFPTVDLSLEQRITNRFSIIGEGGYSFYHFSSSDTSFVHPNGYKLRMEARCYHPFAGYAKRQNLHSSLTGFYIGYDVFYRQEQYNSSVQFTAAGDTTVYTDAYWTKKKALGTNLTMGYQWTPIHRLVADAYFGVGFLHRMIDRHELTYSADEGATITSSTQVNSFFSARDLSEKNGYGLSLSFGVRIGYVIY